MPSNCAPSPRRRSKTGEVEFIRRKATDPLREKSARISASSFIHRARSLFTADTVARIRDLVEIPEPLPFSGVKVETVYGPRYRATFDMMELLESARAELAAEQPEQWKIFLLGAMAGLRRNEIDVLPWTAFRWNEGVIRIETTEHYRPKSHNSEGDVRVDPELLELFRGYHARRKSEFVIESDSPPPAFDAPYGVYRCMKEMRALLAWLRAKGVVSKTPLHTLRKEYGCADPCPLRAARRQRSLAAWRGCGDRAPLRREQESLGFGFRPSVDERRADDRSNGGCKGRVIRESMKRLFATLALALALMAGAWAQERGCLRDASALPNTGPRIKDLPMRRAQYVVIRFAKPFETDHSNWENEDGGKNGKVRITEIQLYYVGEAADLKALTGKKVIAEGEVMERTPYTI